MRRTEAIRTRTRADRSTTPFGIFAAAVWIAAVAGAELAGRRSTSDVGDSLGVLGLFVLCAITAVWHRGARLGWVAAGVRALRRGVAAIVDRQAAIGIDFRRGTLDPFGYPRLLTIFLLVSSTVGFVAACWPGPGSPIEDVRSFLASRAFVVYLMLLALLWVGLLFLILTSLLLFAMVVHDQFVARSLEPRSRSLRPEVATLVLASGGTIAAGVALGPHVAVLAMLGMLALLMVTAILPVTHPVKMVWKSRGTGGTLRGVSVRWLSATEGVQLVIAMTAVVFLALGNVVRDGSGPVSETTPVSDVLGRVLAWSGALGCGAYVGFVWSMLLLGHRLDPRRRVRPSVHLTGIRGLARRARIRRAFHELGWNARFAPRPPGRDDVRIEIVDGPVPPLVDQARWPLRVNGTSLGKRSLLERMARRDVIQRRRRLVRGLERLFKIVAGRRYEKGEGYWVGPQHWFILGLSRDESESDFDPYRDTWMRQHIGPAFSRLLDWPARQHLHHVLWCLDVDLVFLEDGVGFRGLRQVLRILFEIHDTYGGDRRLEERMLAGVPGIRAIIQEVGLEEGLDSKRYPEPDYEDIGRARVLHLFRDRGGDVESSDVPTESDRLPVLVS